MMKIAVIKNNVVDNVVTVDDIENLPKDFPKDYIDITELPCGIGDPVKNGVPVSKPSRFHSVKSDGSGWEVTKENKTLKDAQELGAAKASEIAVARENSPFIGLSPSEAEKFIDDNSAKVVLKGMLPFILK